MYVETKDDSSHAFCWNANVDLVDMSQQKAEPATVRILRRKYYHQRSLSEHAVPNQVKLGSTLSQLISEDIDSSCSTGEDRSLGIVESWKSTSLSTDSFSGQDRTNEIYGLRSQNNELMEYLMKQRGQIDELENKVEILVDALKHREEDIERVLENNAVNEKCLQEMAVLETDKWKLNMQIGTLKQVIQEQAETLEKMSEQEQRSFMRKSSTHMLNSPENGTNDASYTKTLQHKIDELSLEVSEKDNEIRDLTEVLQIKEVGLMEFGRAVDETHRRQTHVEDELEAASREADNLRHMTCVLQNTVENKNNELQEIKLKLEAEKEVTMILQVEKKIMTEKYEELAQEKSSNDKTLTQHYDEVIPGGDIECTDFDSEENCFERQVEYSQEDGVEGYCYLGFEQKTQTRKRKTKPTHAPPPVPSQSVSIHPAAKIRAGSGVEAENWNDEVEQSNQAGYEYFSMCTIAVRMNLAEQYNKDEIMAADSGKLWQACQISQIPMNQYYFFIENALREEFELPNSTYRSDETPINAHCCNVM